MQRVYRGYFCGTCNRMAADYGLATRFLINRDSVFLALLAGAQGERRPVACGATCCNPLGAERPLYQQGGGASYAAAVTLCGLEAKLADDRCDEGWARRLLAAGVGRVVDGAGERARAVLESQGFDWRKVANVLGRQAAVEAGAVAGDLWGPAEPTAVAMGEIVAHTEVVAGGRGRGELLRRLGSSLGRLIYWADAKDDLEADLKRGRFNPLVTGGVEALQGCVVGESAVVRSALGELGLERDAELVNAVVEGGLQRNVERSSRKGRRASGTGKWYDWMCCPCDCVVCPVAEGCGVCSCCH